MPNVDAMLRELTSHQFAEWIAFAQLEPFEPQRADYRSAHIVATLANIHRDKKKRSQPYRIEDFVLQLDEKAAQPAKQSWQEQKRILGLYVKAHQARKAT